MNKAWSHEVEVGGGILRKMRWKSLKIRAEGRGWDGNRGPEASQEEQKVQESGRSDQET